MRKILLKVALGLSVLFLVAGQAVAADTSPALPGTLQKLVSHWHLTLVKTFDTDAPGITGYVVKGPNGKMGILYSYKDFVISGSLIDAKGENLTRKYALSEMPKPDFGQAVAKLDKLSHVITEGKAGAPQVYVFADPNCIYCHKFWSQTRKWVKEGKVQLHWILVGFLKDSSPGRAAAIMNAKNPVAALTRNETGFDVGKEEGAIKQMDSIPDDLEKAIKAHEQLMAKLQFTGTPALVYKDAQGKWQGMTGMPKADKFAKELGIGG